MTGEQIREALTEAARAIGCLVHHETDSRRTDPGWPDLLIVHVPSALAIAVECKSQNEKLRPETMTKKGRWLPGQMDWLTALASLQTIGVYICRPSAEPEFSREGEVSTVSYDWLLEYIQSWQEL